MKRLYIFGCILAAMLCVVPTKAQVGIANDKAPILLTAYNSRTVSWRGHILTIPLQKNFDDVTVESSVNWLTAYVDGDRVMATVLTNTDFSSRDAVITIQGSGVTRTVAITQEATKMMEDVTSKKDFNIFADPLYTQLREGVTQEDIDNVTNIFVRNLAQKIFDGTYDFKYRLGTFKCLTSPTLLGKQWGTGKSYDIIQGVTGIMAHPGRFIVAVDGLPDDGDFTAKIAVYTWTVPEGERVKNVTVNLKNGLNFVDNTMPTDGLVYISYYADDPTPYPSISVHIMDGIQNGYLEASMSNEECYEKCITAPYTTIDCVGDRVHSVWECEALATYTKGKYRRFMNVLDTLVAWEQRLQGLEKYNMIPENKTLAYVNYNYYMYQGTLGVSFKYDTQKTVCDPDRIMREGGDVWGYSHEWGHLHQISPYFCWAGMTETTNNINSTYNVLHMGYKATNVHSELGKIRNNFLTGSLTGNSVHRYKAYQERNKFSWNSKMYAMFESMADSAMHSRSENFERASTTQENYPNSYTMFWMIHEYMTKHVSADYTLDLYQAMRETNTRDEKYAILAAAQNAVSGKWAEYQQKYPESCWVTDGYIRSSTQRWDNSVAYIFNFIMQSSLISGYNMYEIYNQLGFIRTIAMSIDDYGTKYYCMTPEMKAEFKADMDALEADGTLKSLPEGMLEEMLKDENIIHFQRPDIPN